jgi:hypothetical protein
VNKREWYIVDEPGPGTPKLYNHYEVAKSVSREFPVRKLQINEAWKEPEEEWVTPTDEDARYRPMVQVCFLGDWYDAELMAVIETDNDDRFVVVHGIDPRDRVETYRLCRMKASERGKR